MSGWQRPRALPTGWSATRRRILDRDGWVCTEPGCWYPAREVDHLVPASQGGTDDDANLASLCRYHHQWKTIAERPNRKHYTSKRPAEQHPGLIG